MKNTLIILCIFLGSFVFGQKAEVDTFNLILSDPFGGSQDGGLYFPIIQTGNNQIDAQINTDLKMRFTDTEPSTESLGVTLDRWGGSQLVELDFGVTYNQNGILSFYINSTGCDGNCYSGTDYFNYSTVSGKYLEFSDIIDLTEEFKSFVNKDKAVQFVQQKAGLKDKIIAAEMEFDQEEYDYLMSEIENCEGDVYFQSFILYPDALEIFNECDFPSAIAYFSPDITLKYSISDIQKFLKVKM
jgi:hypothetical protein